MFGIDDLLLASLVGGGAGALFNRKDPLKGALLGAGMGAGGAALPGLLGGASAAGGTAAGMGAEQAAQLAAQEAGMGAMGGLGWGGATTGVQGAANSAGGLLGAVDQYGKPLSVAMQASQSVAPQQSGLPQIQPSPIAPPTASPNLNQLVQNNQQGEMQRRQLEEQRRKMRQQRIGLMGGR